MRSLSSDSEKRITMSKKFKKVLALVAFGCLSSVVIENVAMSSKDRRHLLCLKKRNKSRFSSLAKKEVVVTGGGDDERHLSKFEKFVDRLLEGEGDNDCDTAYPSAAEDSVVYTSDSAEAQQEPAFDVVPENLDEVLISTVETDDGEILLSPETDQDKILDETERGLVSTYDPQDYDPENATARVSAADADTIAYVVAVTGCPGWYQVSDADVVDEPDMGSDLYEASAVLKCEVCEVTEEAATARRLGKTRKLRQLEDTGQLSAAEMNYTMHALVHPIATECPIQGTNGETYDRVKLLQSENYFVEILGQPITDAELEINNQYIKDNIPNDVGIRDSIKLQIWTLTLHPAVVLMDYETILQKPLDQDIDMLLADENLKGLYISSPPDVNTGEAGVDTGFLIIKPSLKEFDNIVNTFVNTVFDPNTGWNGQGHHGFKGDMSISGFLSWYFANDPGYLELDRCTYAHDADEGCLSSISLTEAKCFKLYDTNCGNPRDCPYDHPDWSAEKREACSIFHRKYYEYRYIFEETHFKKKNKTERIGLFKLKSFLGYCRGPGKNGFLSLTGDVIATPTWQAVCPPTECAEGTYLKNDCTCTGPEDPCAACPSNTFCQRSPTLMCIDCSCGFCDGAGGTACCAFDGNSNFCAAGPGNTQSCDEGNDYFAAFGGSGNVCGGVEFSKTAVPNGCGCKPSSHSPCIYNQDWGQKEEKCFVCTADDLSTGQCDTCKDCLAQCSNSNSFCISTSVTTQEFILCLSSITDPECRSNCHFNCMKN